MYCNESIKNISFRVSRHMKQDIELEALIRGNYQKDITVSIIKSFYQACLMNNNDVDYINLINHKYLKYMVGKYNGRSQFICRLEHRARLPKEVSDMYYSLRDSVGYHKDRTLELACFYYFNILPDELKKTYY